MRTFVKVIVILLLLLISGYFILRYVLFPVVAVDHLYEEIPASADEVYLLDVEQFISLTLAEMWSSPGAVNPFEEEDDKKEEDDRYDLKKLLTKGLWHGIDLPAQLIMYRDRATSSRYKVILPISDPDEFYSFLKKTQEKSGLEEQQATDDSLSGSQTIWVDSLYAIEISKRHLCLTLGAYELHGQPVSAPQDREWTDELYHPKSLVRGLIKQTNSGGGEEDGNSTHAIIDVNSTRGGLEIEVQSAVDLPFDALHSYDSKGAWLSLHVRPDDRRRGKMLTEGPLSSALESAGLKGAALDTLWDGSFDLQINGLTPVRREIVSYSFDDDFNKVETKEVVQQLQADFIARIGLQRPTDSLFYAQGWVKTVDGRDLFVNYPVQEVHYVEHADEVLLSSNAGMSLRPTSAVESEIFCQIDVAGLTAQHELYSDSLHFDTGIRQIVGTMDAETRRLHFEIDLVDQGREGVFGVLEEARLN